MKKILFLLISLVISLQSPLNAQYYSLHYQDGNVLYATTAELDSIVLHPAVVNASGIKSGHEYVDLGLPSGVKWAICNLGAESPTDYGEFFAWGETQTKDSYTADNSLWNRVHYYDLLSSEVIDANGVLTPRYDAVSNKWGENWRMPTVAEFNELIENCTWLYSEQNSTKGYIIIGPNNNSLFLPSAGYNSGGVFSIGRKGYYWSASADYDKHSYYLEFDSLKYSTDHYYARLIGYTIRAVTD